MHRKNVQIRYWNFDNLKKTISTIIHLQYKKTKSIIFRKNGIGILRNIFDPTMPNIKTKQAITKKNIIHLWIT